MEHSRRLKELRDRRVYAVSYMMVCLLTMLSIPHRSFSQEQQQDLNEYYKFPISIGAEYQNYSPFSEYGYRFNIFEISANLRWPVPPLPFLQPMMKGGMIRFDSRDQADPLRWDHTHWFGGLGLVVSHRFAKNFEIGGEIAASFSQAYFPSLLPEAGMIGEKNAIFEGGLRIDLNPSYNFNISIHPNVKYMAAFGPLKDFNGFIFGIGFSGNFRFGKDPDAPETVIRSIQFSKVSIPSLFAAMQSYYAKNPAGTVTLKNGDKKTITDVRISFFQKGFMDSPTPSASIAELKPGESVTVDLLASFNREVFSTEGITPLTGEIIVTYFSGSKPAEQKQPVSYDLYDKTSVTWDDNRKAAAFITPADSALRNYSSFIRQACKDVTIDHYNKNLQFAIQAYYALTELGLIYQVDPTLPFTEVQENPMVVDSISLPRDTLKRITGDCDDITVLFCSLLETIGIETGFITVPGHIYAAFNTKEESKNYEDIHTDRKMTINLSGELWVPVEITMIGSTGFREAWRKGAEEWRVYENEPDKRGFFLTRECRTLYRPVGLRETDLGLQYGNPENIIGPFRKEAEQLIDNILDTHVRAAEKEGTKRSWNSLGIAYARMERYREAADTFTRVLKMDPGNIAARINLANVFFLKKEYPSARQQYLAAARALEQAGKGGSSLMLKLLVNLSRTCYLLKEYDEAGSYFARASEIDPDTAEEYSYIARAADASGSDRESGTGRAAEQETMDREILFMEVEE